MQKYMTDVLKLDRLQKIAHDEKRNQIFHEQQFCRDLLDVIRVVGINQDELSKDFNLEEKPITHEELFAIAEELRYKTEPDCNDFLEFLIRRQLEKRNPPDKMKEYDVSEAEFDDYWRRDEDEDCPTTIFWFKVPIDWLPHEYADAVSAELSIEVNTNDIPINEFSGYDVKISPANRDRDGNMEDYDWQTLFMPYQNVREFVELGERMMNDD